MIRKIYTAALSTAEIVIPAPIFTGVNSNGNPDVVPAKAGNQFSNTRLLRIKCPVSSTGQAKAGLVKPGIIECFRLLLPLTIWSCHAWIAPAFRLYHGLAAAVFELRGSHKDRRRTAEAISQAKAYGYAPIVKFVPLPYNDPRVVIPAEAGIQIRNSAPMAQSKTPNFKGFTVIELVAVIVIIGILAATVLPNINFGTTSSTVSAWGAAYMIASDIRYTQECAMASMVSKSISFTSGQSVYTFPATTPSTSSLDPTGQLPSGVTIGATITFTFNSLGEPKAGGGSSVTVTVGGITRTITVTQYTGMVSIS